ncbi:MAG: SOS response-associated peptidase [Gemmatimonadota bacterium]
MCGRYTLAAGSEELVEAFDVPPLSFAWAARYNIAPGQEVPVAAADRRGRRIGLLTWGLVPGWVDEPGTALVNARSESVMEKPSFREAFERRRCLVPADGFYEWRCAGSERIPHWFFPREDALLSFAGVWERWSRPGLAPRHTFAIVTAGASEDVAPVHDRMPVIIHAGDRTRWLDRSAGPRNLAALLRPAPPGSLECRVVSARVNRVAEDDPALIEPAAPRVG